MKINEDIILKLMKEKTNRPMKFSELMKLFSIPETQRREFRRIVKYLATEGSLVKLRGGRYGLPSEMNLVNGTLQGHPDGYGFVVPEHGDEDIFIGKQKMGGAMHGDIVLTRIENKNTRFSRPEGRVIRVLQRKTQSLVGLFEPLGRDGWVTPSDPKYFQDIFIPGKEKKRAKPGQLVKVEILEFPTRHNPPVGRVIQILGNKDDPEAELRLIFHKHNINPEFPQKVLKEVKQISMAISKEEKKSRRDLTKDLTFTIDGERAKDFDDAISLELEGNNYRLGIHIADVSHFVKEGSAIDLEAFERGTSIYFADGVIPMLPFELTNDICSLKSGVERLTLSVSVLITPKGKIKEYEIFPAIIKSKHRFTYTQVAQLLETGNPEDKFSNVLPTLKNCYTLSQSLRKLRFQSGSVDFNIPEPEIILGPKGNVEKIFKAEHNAAHELIEEFMLIANQIVAQHLDKKNIPGIHRVHESPDEDKLFRFNEFIKDFGYRLSSVRNVKSTSLHQLLKKTKGRPEEKMFNTLLLRTMKKAIYSNEDPGHFCLGFQHYTHFTSPIRRYPDLITHRMVKSFLTKKKCSIKERKQIMPRTIEFAKQSTDREIKAQSLEREIQDLRRAQYMADRLGEIYQGSISNVAQFGFFVELENIFIEGMVHVSTLQDDYYVYYEHEHLLKGQHTHKTFCIGDPVKVRVVKVDLSKKHIDLTLVSKN